MITLLIKLIKLLVVNRVAYAFNYIECTDKNHTNYNQKFYKIEKVLITDIFIGNSSISYMLVDLTTNEDWGDSTEQIYFSKRKASKELLKLCKL